MFSNILEMRKTDLNGTRMSILFETTYSNIIDYDYRQEMWYWVSTESHRVSGVSHSTLSRFTRFLLDLSSSSRAPGNLILRLRKVGARLRQGLEQGPGKVGARSGQKARFGQGLGRQGLSKVRARLGHEIVIMGLISDRGRR